MLTKADRAGGGPLRLWPSRFTSTLYKACETGVGRVYWTEGWDDESFAFDPNWGVSGVPACCEALTYMLSLPLTARPGPGEPSSEI